MSTKLSAVDFLKLADELRVEAVDLADVGRSGLVFVRELTDGEREGLTRLKGQIRFKGRTSIIDSKDFPKGGSARVLKMGLVTDETGRVQMFDELKKQLGTDRAVMEHFAKMPNAVVNLLVKQINILSGITEKDDDADEDEDEAAAAHEEKKGNS